MTTTDGTSAATRAASKEPRSRRVAYRATVLLLLSAAGWACLTQLVGTLPTGSSNGGTGWLLALTAATVTIAVIYFFHCLWWWRERWRGGSWALLLRLALYTLVGHWLVYLAFFQPFRRVELLRTWVVAGAVLALLATALQSPKPLAPRWKALDLGVYYLCLALVGGEIALRTTAAVHPSALLDRPNAKAARRIAALRRPPGFVRFGFPANSRGYYDVELQDVAYDKLVVAIGDSFSQGVVPHHYHFTTIAERRLPGVQIYNVGIGGIDPPEYLHLLRTEVLPLDPDAIVIDLFLGNDLTFDMARPEESFIRSWLAIENVLLIQAPRRWIRLREITSTSGNVLEAGNAEGVLEQRPDILVQHFPWLRDPSLEEATFSAERYYPMKLERIEEITNQSHADYLQRLEVLREITDLCGDIPVLFLLIPDELQVDDELWNRIAGLSTQPLKRNRALGIVRTWLKKEGLPFVDLLPIYRSRKLLDDGRPHLYHFRDTHLNSRGNRVTGEALAKALPALLATDS